MNNLLRISFISLFIVSALQAADMHLSAPSANTAVVNLSEIRRAIKHPRLAAAIAVTPIVGASLYHSYKNNPNNRLWWTIEKSDNPQAVKALIKTGASVHGSKKYNPLTLAAQNGRTESARVLLEQGANAKGVAFTQAVKANKSSMVWLLMQHGAIDLPLEINMQYFQYLLWVAKQNQENASHYLKRIDPNDMDKKKFFQDYIEHAESIQALIKIKTGAQLPKPQVIELTPEQEINMAFNIQEGSGGFSETSLFSSITSSL
ncbi:MAG TPA: ankyrin repeat domain-containing protein [Candidatus Babeliales bacterium]|nr:ankyrin repeat domain-containing protein [Candidatus Babeliales bacterium]